MGSLTDRHVTEHERRPRENERTVFNMVARLAADTVGPAWVLHEFDSDAVLVATSTIVPGELPPALASSPLWAVVRRDPRPDSAGVLIQVGGPDVVFTFRIHATERILTSVLPSPFRRSPSDVDVERALEASDAVFRTGGMLRRNESTGKWTSFLAEAGDAAPITRAFDAICYPACQLKEYTAACVTEKQIALIEVGRAEHIFAFTRDSPSVDLAWHRVFLRTRRNAKQR